MATPVVGGILSDQAAAVRMINDQMLRMTNDQAPMTNAAAQFGAAAPSLVIGAWSLRLLKNKGWRRRNASPARGLVISTKTASCAALRLDKFVQLLLEELGMVSRDACGDVAGA